MQAEFSYTSMISPGRREVVDLDSLTGRTAVVTGAASGIGRAITERFAAEGMNVVLADVEEGALAAATASLVGAEARAVAVPTGRRTGRRP